MKWKWLLSVFIVSFLLLASQKTQESASLKTYFRQEKNIRLSSFEEARRRLGTEDKELSKLWESILTGRSAPLSKALKARYERLGLNHIFTPSGFHLSAVLLPFLKIIPTKSHFLFLLGLSLSLLFLPGFSALKRMSFIKLSQKKFSMKMGFIIGLLLDIFCGSFQTSFLSFTYSFLFLGIIYSGRKGLRLITWLFLGQILIAYFTGKLISPLLLLISPLLNLSFGFLLPLLFALSYPLWDWQLRAGLFFLKLNQSLIDLSHVILNHFPFWEITSFTLVIISLALLKRYRMIPALLFILSSSLNHDSSSHPSIPANEYLPRGRIIKRTYTTNHVGILFEDGSCRVRLVRGFWWESCSPRRKSSRKKT
jgi:hypothetical protein